MHDNYNAEKFNARESNKHQGKMWSMKHEYVRSTGRSH